VVDYEKNDGILKGGKIMDYIRLPLEGTKNTRDLVRYPTKDGNVTNFHIYVRSKKY